MTRLPEAGEAQDRIRVLTVRIIKAVPELPNQMKVTTENGVRIIQSNKTRICAGGESYIGGGDKPHTTPEAFSHDVEVRKGEKEGENLILTIEYHEPYTTLEMNPDHGSDSQCGNRPRHVGEQLVITIGPNKQSVLRASGLEISVQPQITEQDIELVATFLYKALAQHQESERRNAEESERKLLETAREIRASLMLL